MSMRITAWRLTYPNAVPTGQNELHHIRPRFHDMMLIIVIMHTERMNPDIDPAIHGGIPRTVGDNIVEHARWNMLLGSKNAAINVMPTSRLANVMMTTMLRIMESGGR